MKQATYYARLGSYTMPKNKLQQATLQLLIDVDGTLTTNVEQCIATIKLRIQRLNEIFNTCKPLEPSITESWITDRAAQTICLHLGSHMGCNFYFHGVKPEKHTL